MHLFGLFVFALPAQLPLPVRLQPILAPRIRACALHSSSDPTSAESANNFEASRTPTLRSYAVHFRPQKRNVSRPFPAFLFGCLVDLFTLGPFPASFIFVFASRPFSNSPFGHRLAFSGFCCLCSSASDSPCPVVILLLSLLFSLLSPFLDSFRHFYGL